MSVDVELTGNGETLSTPVGQDRFLPVEIPADAWQVLTTGGALTATAKDAEGRSVATATTQSLANVG